MKAPKMKIFNLHTKNKKEAEDFKVVAHEEYDKYGKLQTNKYVEFTIVGKNRSWTDFMPIKEFKKRNPEIKVKGLK